MIRTRSGLWSPNVSICRIWYVCSVEEVSWSLVSEIYKNYEYFTLQQIQMLSFLADLFLSHLFIILLCDDF